jgi:ribose transport system ATP-binding protein
LPEQYALQLHKISKSFGTVQVLKDVSLRVKRGSIFGLVGENGAGKSTMMNILGGVVPKNEGEILIHGQVFEPKNPMDSKHAGVAFVHQELNLFDNLSVAENLYITEMASLVNFREIKRKTSENLKRLKIEDIKPDTIVGDLPLGKRQLVEITKAVVGDADIIILDEPTTSLSTKEKEKLFAIMRDLQSQGKTMIYISHILEDVFAMCDEIAVLRDGCIIFQKPTEELTEADVIRGMVGRELNQIYPKIEKKIGDVIYQAKNICNGQHFENVSIELREGEIVGLYGLMGAGRTELLNCLFGLEPITSGEIIYNGRTFQQLSPIICIENEMAYVTENRHEEGLMLPMTVRDNVVVTNLNELAAPRLGTIDVARETAIAEEAVANLRVVTHNPHKQAVSNLSGGNQQKVVLGKWLSRRPRIIFMDEPTRGVDVGAKYEIYSIINEMVKEKSAVFMVSSEMEELMGMCDRILVMHNHRITANLPKGEFNQEKLIRAALGEEV